jgi:hypothetical protein
MLIVLRMLAACESPTKTPLISTAEHANWSKHEFDSARDKELQQYRLGRCFAGGAETKYQICA